MKAKLIAYGATRDEAIDRLCRGIDEYYIKGVKNTLEFGKWAVQTEPFRTGKFDTKFIEKFYKPEYLQTNDEGAEEVAAILSAYTWENGKQAEPSLATQHGSVSKWRLNRR